MRAWPEAGRPARLATSAPTLRLKRQPTQTKGPARHRPRPLPENPEGSTKSGGRDAEHRRLLDASRRDVRTTRLRRPPHISQLHSQIAAKRMFPVAGWTVCKRLTHPQPRSASRPRPLVSRQRRKPCCRNLTDGAVRMRNGWLRAASGNRPPTLRKTERAARLYKFACGIWSRAPKFLGNSILLNQLTCSVFRIASRRTSSSN